MSTEQLIRISSWNVAGHEPMQNATLDYLFDDMKRISTNIRPDIQIVGLQEAPQYLFTDPWSSNLSSTLKKKGYILFKRHKLSGILLYIFVLKEIMLRARDFETESVRTGFGGLLGNKGGVSLRFTLNGNSFSVTNAHLAAHQEKLQERVNDYKSIRDGTKFTLNPNATSILDNDYAFWFGDLNFRFDDIEKHEVLNVITKSRTASSEEEKVKAVTQLYKNDQLSAVKKKGLAFLEFNETLPKFLPTYKFQIGSKDNYDSENRIPAWTDRVLYRVNQESYNLNAPMFKPKVEQLFYDCIPETNLSDHKPVVSLFRVTTYDPKKYNPSPVPYDILTFLPISGWKSNEDGRLWYKVSNEVFYTRPKLLSSWDRLALYKAEFGSLEEYQTLMFVNNIARVAPRLDAQEIAYAASAPSSRAPSPSGSRRSSTSSNVSVGRDALELNETAVSAATATASRSASPIPTSSYTTTIPENAVIGDGFKYFSVVFSDEHLLPGRYVVLYLKTNRANEYDVYGMSEPFDVASA